MHLFRDPASNLQVLAAYSVRWHRNSRNATHIILSSPELGTVSIREIYYQKCCRSWEGANRSPLQLQAIALSTWPPWIDTHIIACIMWRPKRYCIPLHVSQCSWLFKTGADLNCSNDETITVIWLFRTPINNTDTLSTYTNKPGSQGLRHVTIVCTSIHKMIVYVSWTL